MRGPVYAAASCARQATRAGRHAERSLVAIDEPPAFLAGETTTSGVFVGIGAEVWRSSSNYGQRAVKDVVESSF